MNHFTDALNEEYGSGKIRIQCVQPGFVDTKMIRPPGMASVNSLFVTSAKDYVKSAISRLGLEVSLAL